MIPKCISDISHEWITDLMKKLHPFEYGQSNEEPPNSASDLTSLTIQSSANSHDELFECCRLSFAMENLAGKQQWLVKLMPTDPDLRDIVLRHDLFKKEMLLHQVVIPQLQDLVTKTQQVTGFPIPMARLLHGEFDDDSGLGVLVFSDLQSLHYELADPDLKRISSQSRIEKVVSTLAAFHAVCTAFEQSQGNSLEQLFPFLNTGAEGHGNIWFHADMQIYVEEMYETCLKFLKSIPGHEETSRWFEQRMKNPEALQNSEQHLKTLVHGDLWHNNIYFHRHQGNVLFGSWQMCHYGSAATDLCFFLCSSTTTSFRRENWDRVIRLYFDEFSRTLQNLMGSNSKLPSFEDFLTDIRASIPISIFFCANFRDLDSDCADSMASMASGMEKCYGPEVTARQESLQDLHGSFCRLQNSYSVYMMQDMSVIREQGQDDENSDEDEDEDEDDDAGIIISFGHNHSSKVENVGATSTCCFKPPAAAPAVETVQGGPSLHFLERKPVTKVPTVASDKELEDILEARSHQLKSQKKSLDPRKARALRRKLYLDLYSEVAQRMLI